MGQGIGQTWACRSRSLARLRGGEGWAAAGHCPVHGASFLASLSCSTAGHDPSHGDNWCPLILSGLPTPLWVIQGTVSDCLQRKGRLACMCGSSDGAMSVSRVRQKHSWYTSSPGTCAPGQHWVVGQVPFSSIHGPLTCPQDTCGLDKGTMRNFSAFSFPLRLHFYLNFFCLWFPVFGSCYSTGLNYSSQPWIFSLRRNSQAISKLFSNCFPCC